MKFIAIGIIRFFYVAITGLPALFIFFIYEAGGGDGGAFMEKWLAPVLFGEKKEKQ